MKIVRMRPVGGLSKEDQLLIQQLKIQINQKIGEVYYDSNYSRYLGFSDIKSRDTYLSNPENNYNLVLGKWGFNISEVTLTFTNTAANEPLVNTKITIEGEEKLTNETGQVSYYLSKGNYKIHVDHPKADVKEMTVVENVENIRLDYELFDTDKTYMVFTVVDNQTINLSYYMDGIHQVNWGDGTVDANSVQTYTTGGDYNVIITHTEDSRFSWQGCNFLKEVKSIGKLNKTDFQWVFSYARSLEKIHAGAFDNCVNITTFRQCFQGCESLTSIEEGLFDKNVNVVNFYQCFEYCRNLTSIPSGLFDNCPNMTDFGWCFNRCSSLTSIPTGLFDKNVKVTNFERCFFGCSSLNQPYNCTSEGLPKLWERDGTNGAVIVSSFNSFATEAHSTFRATIPAPWGGTVKSPMSETILIVDVDNESGYINNFYSINSYIGGYEPIIINWGDGVEDTFECDEYDGYPNTNHQYSELGRYTITIKHSIYAIIGNIDFASEIVKIGNLNQDLYNSTSSGGGGGGGAYSIETRDGNFPITRPNNILTKIHAGALDNFDKVKNFSYWFASQTQLRDIPDGLFDKCVSVTNFERCFFNCPSLNQPYNCTSEGLPKLWEREGVSGQAFASATHETFKSSVPPKWGDGYQAHVKFSLVVNGGWLGEDVVIYDNINEESIDCTLSSDLTYRTVSPISDFGIYGIIAPSTYGGLYTFKADFDSTEDLDLGVLFVGDNSTLDLEYLDFTTMTNEELSEITSLLSNWSIDTVNGETGLVNSLCDTYDIIEEGQPMLSVNNLVTFKDVVNYDVINCKSTSGEIGLGLLDDNRIPVWGDMVSNDLVPTYVDMLSNEDVRLSIPNGVGRHLFAVGQTNESRCIIKNFGRCVPPTKPQPQPQFLKFSIIKDGDWVRSGEILVNDVTCVMDQNTLEYTTVDKILGVYDIKLDGVIIKSGANVSFDESIEVNDLGILYIGDNSSLVSEIDFSVMTNEELANITAMNNGWTIQTIDGVGTGLVNNKIADGQQTAIAFKENLKNVTIDFNQSSEACCDYAQIQTINEDIINITEQGDNSKLIAEEFNLIKYVKDGSVSTSRDNILIRKISGSKLPPMHINDSCFVFTMADGETLDLSAIKAISTDWGDGVVDNTTSHTYTVGGNYTVVITHSENSQLRPPTSKIKEIVYIGEHFKFNYSLQGKISGELLDTVHPGAFDAVGKHLTSLYGVFERCVKLDNIPTGLFDTCVNVTDFSYCFSGCSSLDQPYNLTSPHLPKLWERDGTNGAVIDTYASFASGAHTTFRDTVPITWGGTLTI